MFNFLSYNREAGPGSGYTAGYYWRSKEGVERENTNSSGSSGIADAFNPEDARRSDEEHAQGVRGMSEEERRSLKTHQMQDGHIGSMDSGIGILQGGGLQVDRKVPVYHPVEDGKVLDSIFNAGFGPIGNHFDMDSFYPAASSDSDSESLSG